MTSGERISRPYVGLVQERQCSSVKRVTRDYYLTIVNFEVLLYRANHCLVLFKNQQECIIRLKNSRQSRVFLNLIIHNCEIFERLQTL